MFYITHTICIQCIQVSYGQAFEYFHSSATVCKVENSSKTRHETKHQNASMHPIKKKKKKKKMKERERDRSNERKEGKGRHVTGFDLLFARNQLRDPFLVIPERGGVSTRPPSELSLVFNR